jgi:hypothetical protein
METLDAEGIYPSVHQGRRRMHLRVDWVELHRMWRELIIELGYPSPDGSRLTELPAQRRRRSTANAA